MKFHIIPVVNPDGFAFSHSNSRYWRKNRRPHSDPLCIGVDLNRNFPFHWKEVGGDTYACSEAYVGPSACSEPECQALKKFMDGHKDEIDTYITMHSYGQVRTSFFNTYTAQVSFLWICHVGTVPSESLELQWQCSAGSETYCKLGNIVPFGNTVVKNWRVNCYLHFAGRTDPGNVQGSAVQWCRVQLWHLWGAFWCVP